MKDRSINIREKITAQFGISAGALVAVVGAGASGEAAARLLVFSGFKVRLIDRNAENIPENFKAFAVENGMKILGGEHSPEQFAGAALVVTSPGVPVAKLLPLIEKSGSNAALAGELELALACTDIPMLAVTGSSGKTTTVSLAAAMLEEAGKKVFLGGNIGTPLSSFILEGGQADALVLELSSFQLQSSPSVKPRAAILLNITPNHLDHHKDMGEYADAKFNMLARQDENDLAVLPVELRDEFKKRGMRARLEIIKDTGRFKNMLLSGGHNAMNAEAAFLAAKEFGVSENHAVSAASRFEPLRHRLESVATVNGTLYVNDSKCTTVDSMRAALQSFEAPIILLAGGKFKGGDLAGLAPLLKEKVKAVILFGASREIFTEAWQGLIPLSWHERLEPALAEARLASAPGDVVLLSPATASYDLYKNYKERGDHFCRLVKEFA